MVRSMEKSNGEGVRMKAKKSTVWVEENLNPDGKKIGDCGVRAIAKATGKSYETIEEELIELLREIKFRNYSTIYTEYNNRRCVHKLSFPAKKGYKRMDAETFARTFPNGRYVLNLAHHMVACVDGKIYDIWDCSKKCVYSAWQF